MIGQLEVIFGCMFAGKSEELIRRLRRAEIAKQKVIVFKPSIDNRYSDSDVVSHSGLKANAIPVVNELSIPKICRDFGNFDVVAIDETQFFNENLLNVIDELINIGVIVICAGLNQDFRGQGFGIMPEIIARADKITHLTAICNKCGGEATKTQRILNGNPAPFDSPTVIVGANEQYEARCNNCYEKG